MEYVARDCPSCPKIELQYFLYFYGINLEREIHEVKTDKFGSNSRGVPSIKCWFSNSKFQRDIQYKKGRLYKYKFQGSTQFEIDSFLLQFLKIGIVFCAREFSREWNFIFYEM